MLLFVSERDQHVGGGGVLQRDHLRPLQGRPSAQNLIIIGQSRPHAQIVGGVGSDQGRTRITASTLGTRWKSKCRSYCTPCTAARLYEALFCGMLATLLSLTSGTTLRPDEGGAEQVRADVFEVY